MSAGAIPPLANTIEIVTKITEMIFYSVEFHKKIIPMKSYFKLRKMIVSNFSGNIIFALNCKVFISKNNYLISVSLTSFSYWFVGNSFDDELLHRSQLEISRVISENPYNQRSLLNLVLSLPKLKD